ncbi:unnamed protein product [Ascophyllum nodosum]
MQDSTGQHLDAPLLCPPGSSLSGFSPTSSALTGTRNSALAAPASSAPTRDHDGGAVDISSWNFFKHRSNRTTPFLVGPVVGAVTETTARVLVEVNASMLVTMEAFQRGNKRCTVSKDVRGKTPTAFMFTDLSPGRRHRVVVTLGETGENREAQFTTTSDKQQWKIVTVSCNCHTHIEELKLWDRIRRVIGQADCVLHLGDQIYADEDFHHKRGEGIRFDSAWRACLKLLDGVAKGDWSSRRAQLLELYREVYRKTWNFPSVAAVLASAANYMICDDHEVVDDLAGDEPEHCDPTSVEFYVAKVGYQAYCEYQMQLLKDVDVTDHTLKPYYGLRLSPKVGVFITENRVVRSLHRKNGSEAEWKDREFLGPSQWNRLTEAFSTDFKECETVLLGTPTPLVLISQGATGVVARIMDDARGSWGHKRFSAEQKAFGSFLTDWQNAKPNRALLTVAGDVHIGGYTDSWHKGSNVPLHQMTASAVGNTPEKEIDGIKAALMRGVMHADEKFFPFEVKHYDWIFGPNYGMVDFNLNQSKRPDVSFTLVPQIGTPRVRNLQFGNPKVSVQNSDQSPASQSANATAKVIGVPPEGIPTATPGGPDDWCCCTVT